MVALYNRYRAFKSGKMKMNIVKWVVYIKGSLDERFSYTGTILAETQMDAIRKSIDKFGIEEDEEVKVLEASDL